MGDFFGDPDEEAEEAEEEEVGGVTTAIAAAEVNWRGERLRLGLGDAWGDLLPGVCAPPVPAPVDDEGREEGERDGSELRGSMGVVATPPDPGITPTPITVEVAEVTPCNPGFTCGFTKSKCC